MNDGDPSGDAAGSRPGAHLDGAAAAAFEAFNAMETTKRRHFGLLARLDAKRERYGLDPTRPERELLAHLLADHDAQVGRFTRAAGALKASDLDAHRALFRYVGTIATDDALADPADDASGGTSGGTVRGPTH